MQVTSWPGGFCGQARLFAVKKFSMNRDKNMKQEGLIPSSRIEVFPWSPLLVTGIATIDLQHERLVLLLNELASAYVSTTKHAAVSRIIDELADYAVYHFETEEAIWKAELPDDVFSKHQQSHTDFRAKIDFFRKQTNDPAHLAENLLGFLTEWLAFHILESDRQLAWVVLAMQQGSDYAMAKAQVESRMLSEDGRLSRVIMSLYQRMSTTALALMRAQEFDAQSKSLAFESERSLLQQDLLRAQKIGRIGNWSIDLASQLIRWSPETYRLFDVPQDAPIHLDDFLNNVFEADRERVRAAWNAALKGQPYDIEHRTKNSNGQRWVREVAELDGWIDGVATVAFGTVQDVTDIIQYQQQLERVAYVDTLTGLPNRRATLSWLDERLPAITESSIRLCFFMIDLDGLHEINLGLGRAAGDQILRIIAERLQQRSGADFVGHLGADQFALAYVDCRGLLCQADRSTDLIALIEEHSQVAGSVVSLSACIGSVKIQGESGVASEGLLRFANLALYQAKLKGRGSRELTDYSEHEGKLEEVARINDIGLGLVNNQFALFYQPKIDLTNGELIGVEGLIRWQHPERGLLPPAAFIDKLEGSPLLIELGDWVINQALAQIRIWSTQGLSVPVSVNVATSQLLHPDFISKLADSMGVYPDLPKLGLELEFLETGQMVGVEKLKSVIDCVRQMGVNMSLDDFGTGIASMRVLSDLKLSIIKIDRSFVAGMSESVEDLAIVRSSLALGNALGCQVIAEGVETELEVSRLLELGYRYIQGYVVARPMPAEQLLPWLDQWRNNPPSWAPWLTTASR
jgi:hemerythrin-like metal-binding protein/diguanylate cyclase (GGDEF)-like protein